MLLKGVETAVSGGKVTADFGKLIPGAHIVSCSEFGDIVTSAILN